MSKKHKDFFWMSFSDLMTSLFFVVLVLYVLTYVMLKQEQSKLVNLVEDLEQKLEVYNLVEQNLKPLKNNSELFRYEEKYKRFTLAFDVNFKISQFEIKKGKLKNFQETSGKIISVGKELKKTIDVLAKKKAEDPSMNKVSYLVIISGYASHLLNGSQINDYQLSYKRAYSLWNYWKDNGIDFESNKYKGLIDLQISGNGWGGVGRFERDPDNYFLNEIKNQRFIIQIVPKIGNTN